MLRRTAGAGVAGVVIAILLFVAMQTLISRPRSAGVRPDYPLIDFVHLKREPPPPPPLRREPPELPPPPQALPSPSLTLQAPRRPQLDTPQIEMAAAIAPAPLLDMVPLPSPAPVQSDELGLADQELIPLVRVPPRYPLRAARFQIEGFVTVEFTITKDGSVREPAVVESSPPDIFDTAALRAIVQWKFKPRTKDGRAVASRALQRIDFALRER